MGTVVLPRSSVSRSTALTPWYPVRLLHTEQADRVDTLCPTRHAVSDINNVGDNMTTLQEHIGGNVKSYRGNTSPREFGAALAPWLGKPWTRQAVWEAENGKRAFT